MPHPLGALQTLEEFNSLIDQSNYQSVYIYPYNDETGKPLIRKVELHPHTAIRSVEQAGPVTWVRQGGLLVEYVLLRNRNVGGPTASTAYIFTNYWYAYAHLCRRTAELAKGPMSSK